MKYRPDIDGLRAIAVVAVLLFHGHVLGFGGGFVGVDVFFVISGYLITTLIVKEREAGRFSLAGFYERRVRRLIPAAAAMVVVSSVFAWLMMLPGDFSKFSQSLAAYAVFASNWYFLGDVSYFTNVAEQKVLLHTWSLSVEEQFYLLFPILMMIIAGNLKRLGLVLGLFAASAYYANWLWNSGDHNVLFFSSLARAWEPLLGCAAAFVSLRLPVGRVVAFAMRLTGLVLIGYAVTTFRPSLETGFVHLLVPCVGAALLLMASTCRRPEPIGAVLGSLPMRSIGLVSYSLYLWHWPVLVFARLFFGDLSPTQTIMCFALAAALSVVSYRLIEKPVRQRALLVTRRAAFSMAGVLAAAYLAFGAIGFYTNGLPSRVPEDALQLAKTASEFGGRSLDLCFNPEDGPMSESLVRLAKQDKLCVIGAGNRDAVDFVLIGDSHGFSSLTAFDDLAKKYHLSVMVALHAGCPPLKGTQNGHLGHEQKCTDFFDATQELIKKHDIPTVVFAARWSMYVLGELPDGSKRGNSGYLRFADDWNRETNTEKIFEQSLHATLDGLGDRNVVILKEVPTHRSYVSQTLAIDKMLGSLAKYRDHRWTTEAEHRLRNVNIDAAFAKEAASRPNVALIDPVPKLCPDGGTCLVVADGQTLYWNDDHINRYGARFIEPIIAPTFANLVPRARGEKDVADMRAGK